MKFDSKDVDIFKYHDSGNPLYLFKLCKDGAIERTEVKEWGLDCYGGSRYTPPFIYATFRIISDNGTPYTLRKSLYNLDTFNCNTDKYIISFNKECDAKGIIREAFNNLLSKKRAERAHLEKQITEITEKLTALDKNGGIK